MTSIRFVLFFWCCLFVTACGGGIDGASNAQVEDLFFDSDRINVGEGTVVRVRFSLSGINSFDDIFDEQKDVVVVVVLPPELRYRSGTAEVQDDGDDERVGAEVIDCEQTGEQFLAFRLDDDDLSGASNPSGDGDVELGLIVDAVSSADSAIVGATARNNSLSFTCGTVFDADRRAVISITDPTSVG